MSVITGESTQYFKSASALFSKAKRFLSTYDTANLIDEGEFPTYVKEVLRLLGVGVYKEQDAVLRVKNFKAVLPDDFAVLYAAYKCTPGFTQKDLIHPQGGLSVFNDITWEVLGSKNGCEIEMCRRDDDKVLERITVRRYVEEKNTVIANLMNPILLRLSPNVKRNKCTEDCENILASAPYEITISDGFLYTNFDKDCIYIKYYGLALDESGVPEIPDVERIEKAIEWYIIYQLSLKWWFNNQVPDLEKRWQYAEVQYNNWFEQARYERKLPSFSRMINLIRRQRSTNKVQLMRQIDINGYWQSR